MDEPNGTATIVEFEARPVIEPEKRKRGRPPKQREEVSDFDFESAIESDDQDGTDGGNESANTNQNRSQANQFRIQTPSVTTGKRPGRPRKQTSEAAAKDAASAMLMMAEALAVANLGAVASFNPFERSMIQPPLANILARLKPETTQKFGAVMDPVVLLAGLAMWYMRIQGTMKRASTAKSGTPSSAGEAGGSAGVAPPVEPASEPVPTVNGSVAPPPMSLLLHMNRGNGID
jgi:hypothetical protein